MTYLITNISVQGPYIIVFTLQKEVRIWPATIFGSQVYVPKTEAWSIVILAMSKSSA